MTLAESPLDVLFEVMTHPSLLGDRSIHGLPSKHPPGYYIARLPEEKRALLRQLTSDMTRTMLDYAYYGGYEGGYGVGTPGWHARREKMRFDREVLRLR